MNMVRHIVYLMDSEGEPGIRVFRRSRDAWRFVERTRRADHIETLAGPFRVRIR